MVMVNVDWFSHAANGTGASLLEDHPFDLDGIHVVGRFNRKARPLPWFFLMLARVTRA
jgi:hypothetical protein